MSTYITLGNLTKDAETKEDNGRSYVILRIAENVYERDGQGKILKDQNGHYKTKHTFYHSVFVNEKAGALAASKFEKGHPVKVFGTPRLETVKGTDGFDQIILKGISAYKIDSDPFKNRSEEEIIDSEEGAAEIHLSA